MSAVIQKQLGVAARLAISCTKLEDSLKEGPSEIGEFTIRSRLHEISKGISSLSHKDLRVQSVAAELRSKHQGMTLKFERWSSHVVRSKKRRVIKTGKWTFSRPVSVSHHSDFRSSLQCSYQSVLAIGTGVSSTSHGVLHNLWP
jgi:hypothetical protein